MARWKSVFVCGLFVSFSAVTAVPTGGCEVETDESTEVDFAAAGFSNHDQYGRNISGDQGLYGQYYSDGGFKESSDEASGPSAPPATTAVPREMTTMLPDATTTTSSMMDSEIAESADPPAIPVPDLTTSNYAVAALPENTTPRKASWKDHPLYRSNPSIQAPIVAWYTTRADGRDPERILVRGRHTRQGSKYKLMRETEDSDQLMNVDLLQLSLFHLIREDDSPLEFETTRASRVCLVMDVREPSNGGKIHQAYSETSDFEMQGPPGYDINLGIAEWDTDYPLPRGGPASENPDEPPPRGYVVCRNINAGRHTMPGAPMLGAQWHVHLYAVLFAEADGSVPPLTPSPPGWSGPEIKQHELCPDELHDMWSVGPPDSNDPDTVGKRFKTWHPQKDPLFGCYYGHEHGSFDGLAGYTSRFDYTAWKNGRQDESHQGFKNYVIPTGDKFVIVNLHAATDDFNRFQVDLHTMVVAVTDRASGKLLSEISCKSHSGGSGAQYLPEFRPANNADEPSMLPMGDEASRQRTIDMWAMGEDREMVVKRINLLDPDNKNPKLIYEGDENTAQSNLRGRYEGWFMKGMAPFCMSAGSPKDNAGPDVDIKNPQNGCMDVECKRKIILGLKDRVAYMGDDGFFPNLGTERRIGMRKLRIAPDLCAVDLPEPNSDGYIAFYTNPTCEELCDGPSPNCILQRIHSSFTGHSIDDVFVTNDAHGHNPYIVEGPRGVPSGQRGIAQVEGALGISAEMP